MRRHNDTKQGNCVPGSGFSLGPGGGGSDRLTHPPVARIGFKLGKCRAFEEQRKIRTSGVPNGFGVWGPPTLKKEACRYFPVAIGVDKRTYLRATKAGLDGGVVR